MSKRGLIVPAFLVLILAGCKTLPSNNINVVNKAESTYEVQLKNIKAQSQNADFTRLRIAFTDTAAYSPYTAGSTTGLWEALNAKEYDKCLQLATEKLVTNYTSLDAHYVAMACNFESEKLQQGKYHRYVFDGLVNSIKQSGDGKTSDTAYQIISSSELYSFLAILNLQVKGQSLLNVKGRLFDLMQVITSESDEEFGVYFDISLQMSKGMKFLN